MAKKNQAQEQTTIEPTKKRRIFTRRRFLQAGAIMLGGAVAGIYFGRTPFRRWVAHSLVELDVGHGTSNFEPDIVFEMQADNTLQVNVVKAEMGQGIFTGIAMLVMEEIDMPFENINVVPTTTGTGLVDLGTGGSNTTSSFYTPMRELAATFREMLKMAAARQWSVDVAEVSTADGFVITSDQRISYIDVVNSTTEWEMPEEAPALRPRSEFKVIGTEIPRVDLKPKVMGESIFGIDIELPGMLYANILKCPFIEGTLKSIDVASAKAFPGVVDVVELEDLVAVVADNRYAAEMGKRALNAEWDVPKIWQQEELDEMLTVGTTSPVNLQQEGNAPGRINDNEGTLVTAEYRVPIGVHAHMEPNGAIADVQGDKALVITATQAPGVVRTEVADALGIDAENIQVQTVYLGGGFGRRYWLSPGPDAARISQAVGRPIHLLWDRETEFLCGVVRPATHHVFRAKLSGSGALDALEHNVASGDQGLGLFPIPILKPIFGADLLSASHGAPFLYEVENRETNIWHVDTPFMTGIWRAVGMYPNGFAVESFIDEVAHAAGQDPFDLRLAHLMSDDESAVRMRNVLLSLREASGWDTPKPEGVGRGLAIVEDRRTVAATVIEAKVEDGQIRVTKATSAIDPGVVINPEGVRAQVEGCVMMGISAALYEETVVKDGQFTASNYHKYPMAMLSDTPPEVSVIFVEGSERPSGVGEPPLGPIAPAIANAIFDATGQRLRQLPLQKALVV